MATITINGNVWTTQTMPAFPVAPVGLEVQLHNIVAENTNPFTHQKQFYNWNVSYRSISASYATMLNADAAAWLAFFDSLMGQICVYRFPDSVCALYPYELTLGDLYDTPRYFRQQANSVKWSIAPGSIYTGFTWESDEVL